MPNNSATKYAMEDKKCPAAPNPQDEIERILDLLGRFYEANRFGAREELMTEFDSIRMSEFKHSLLWPELLADWESDLRDGTDETVDERTSLTIRLITIYAALAQCVEALRPGLSVGQQWWWVGWAQNYLGHLQGSMSGEVSGALSSITGRAKNAAASRHKENRAMRTEAFEWLAENMGRFSSMDAAAEAIAGIVVPVTFRTARGWVGQWKKAQSSGDK
jgi:hypothetical protein